MIRILNSISISVVTLGFFFLVSGCGTESQSQKPAITTSYQGKYFHFLDINQNAKDCVKGFEGQQGQSLLDLCISQCQRECNNDEGCMREVLNLCCETVHVKPPDLK